MQAIDLIAQSALSSVRYADVLVGIPSFNSAKTIGYVISQAAEGLHEHYGDQKSLILVSDGGSADETVRVAENVILPKNVKLVTCRYQGVSGKGSAVRAIFEAMIYLGARSLAMIDSDLKSIMPSWIKMLLEPASNGVGLVAPRYNRHKYDGTITNQLCYPMTRALYGRRIRQPIGGDFGISLQLAKQLIESTLWKNQYVPRFGIDIFLTNSAIALGFLVEEADLGVKIHEAKDPALHLPSMFREVLGSLFACMEAYEEFWKKIKGSSPVALRRNQVDKTEPPAISVGVDRLIEEFRTGYFKSVVFKNILSPYVRSKLDASARSAPEKVTISTEIWVKTVYEASTIFKRSDDVRKPLILEGLRAVWSGRVATFVMETASMTNEEAERRIEEDAARFEEMKDQLLRIY
jgi:hypothetical protein